MDLNEIITIFEDPHVTNDQLGEAIADFSSFCSKKSGKFSPIAEMFDRHEITRFELAKILSKL